MYYVSVVSSPYHEIRISYLTVIVGPNGRKQGMICPALHLLSVFVVKNYHRIESRGIIVLYSLLTFNLFAS